MVGVSLSRRQLLWGGAALGGLSLLPRRARAAGERYLIVYWNEGGWDPSMVFDPHFESSLIDRGTATEAATSGALAYGAAADRPAVSAFFDSWGDQTAIVNGIAVGSISHAQCSRRMLTGSRLTTAADLPTRLAAATGSSLALPHLILSGPLYPGRDGAVVAPLNDMLLGTSLGQLPAEQPTTEAREDAIRDYLSATAQRYAGDPVGADFQASLARSERLRLAAAQLQEVGDDRLLRGVTALSLGLSRCVMLQGITPEQSTWDSHVNNERQQSDCYDRNFSRLAALMAMLEAAEAPGGGPLSEQTTVLVLSEMGRTPVLNGADGKDHWPYTSAMLAGAGVRGGVYGATNEALVGQPIDPDSGQAAGSGVELTAAGFLAGILAAFDVDPLSAFPDATPFTAPLQG